MQPGGRTVGVVALLEGALAGDPDRRGLSITTSTWWRRLADPSGRSPMCPGLSCARSTTSGADRATDTCIGPRPPVSAPGLDEGRRSEQAVVATQLAART